MSIVHNPYLYTIGGQLQIVDNKPSLGLKSAIAGRTRRCTWCWYIVKEISKGKRDRDYCATAVLNILEEPAKLVG